MYLGHLTVNFRQKFTRNKKTEIFQTHNLIFILTAPLMFEAFCWLKYMASEGDTVRCQVSLERNVT
jgi:hypothetical protein